MEEGPVVDFNFPPVNFPPEFIKKLAYPSFPDSYTLPAEGHLFYTFTMKTSKKDIKKNIYKKEEFEEFNSSDKIHEKEVKEEKKMIEEYNKGRKNKFMKGISY